MRSSKRLRSVTLLLGMSSVIGVAVAQDQQSDDVTIPNFIIIFTDNQGYADVGCYGARGFTTPHLDRMASEGVRFSSFYAHPACSASRAQLLTGCYPARLSLTNVFYPGDRTGLHPDEVTVAEVLRKRGYTTAIYGKWHLGDAPAFLPTSQGFDEYFGIPYSVDMGPGHATNPERFPDLPLMEGENVIELNPDLSEITASYTRRAVEFIERNTDRPFFLYLPHSMPHVPIFASERFRGKSEQGLYGDVIMEIDWSVGEILAAIKRTGLDDRTMVIFASDNGPWLPYGEHAGSAAPLRGGLGSTFEGGVRVPAIFRWPGKIPAGGVCHELASTIDILPTVARLADAELPDSRIIDGKDIWPLLSGEDGAKTPHEALYYYRHGGLHAVRSGKWKLHFPHTYRELDGPGGKGGKRVPEVAKTMELSLFDLENDAGETTNVADDNPDVVRRLQVLAQRARETLGDKLTDQQGSNVRPLGQL